MGRPLLRLRLEGPLQAWGLRARWDVRDTGDEPSKSGVVGMLGCALGYPMQDPRLEELERQLSMGIRVERPGSRLVDFQTISGEIPIALGGVKGSADDPSTIVSPRAYLQDAAFLVFLDGPPEVLQRCAAALENQRWPVYLGRKACVPSRPVCDGISEEYDSLEDALKREPWDEEAFGTVPERLRCVMEVSAMTVGPAGSVSLRPDRIRANPARMYDSRSVAVFWTPRPEGRQEGGEA